MVKRCEIPASFVIAKTINVLQYGDELGKFIHAVHCCSVPRVRLSLHVADMEKSSLPWVGQEVTVRTGHGKGTGSKSGKEAVYFILSTMLEKTLESPLDCKKIQPVHSERDQPWDFFGRNDAKAETPVLWPPQAKS